MEEVESAKFLGKDIGECLKEMYNRVGRNNPVTGLCNGVIIVMFVEETDSDDMETRIIDGIKEHKHPESGYDYWHVAARIHAKPKNIE